MAAVFIAQSTLQQWADQGKVALEETVLTLIKEKREVILTPAVRFVKLLGAEDDPNQLVGKVKTKTQLDDMGAEHYHDSVLLGDVAYEVVEGFLGDLMAGARPAAKAGPAKAAAPAKAPAPAPAAAAPAPVPEVAEEEPEDDAAALSKLFLDTVQ